MSNPAVRTVREDDDVRVIEGLAYPFRGRDTYGTFFSARTDFHWPLFPDTDPSGASRAGSAPLYIRPATFHHGFDKDFGLDSGGERVGGWSPVRVDADGVWVEAQINKRHQYYATRLAPLLDAGALGLSGGSAEHSVRIDQRSGEVLDWPAYELALTPVESNPLAQIATRAGDALRIIADRQPPKPAATPAVRFHSAADASQGASLLSGLTDLMAGEADEPDQLAVLQRVADGLTEWIGMERAEIGQSGDAEDDDVPVAVAYYSGTRAGRRNSAADAAELATAHNSIATVLGMDCAPGDASARSG